jgi:hypothetical protein
MGVTDPMALLQQFFDKARRIAGALAPNDMVTGADYPGEIESVKFDFLRHAVARTPSDDRGCTATIGHEPSGATEIRRRGQIL